MYIEFDLPRFPDYHQALEQLKQDIKHWAQKYQVPYTEKSVKYTHRLGLNYPDHFVLFAMTWQGDQYRLIRSRGD